MKFGVIPGGGGAAGLSSIEGLVDVAMLEIGSFMSRVSSSTYGFSIITTWVG